LPVFFLAVLAIAAPTESAAVASRNVGDWNQYVLSALKSHARDRIADPDAAAVILASVAREVQADARLSEPNRRRLVGQIQQRLVLSGKRHLAQLLDPGRRGAAREPRGAEDLKDLIEQTIEPESWDVNGGKGHIHVFRE
jgi:hypothetical protein